MGTQPPPILASISWNDMNDSEAARSAPGITGERPYRSHLKPACLECRRRKARCRTTGESHSCTSCRLRGIACIFSRPDRRSASRRLSTKESRDNYGASNALPNEEQLQITSVETGRAQTRSETPPNDSQSHVLSTAGAPGEASKRQLCDTTGIFDEGQDESPHVVGPAPVDDSDELEESLLIDIGRIKHHVRPSAKARSFRRGMLPVMFTSVRRRPQGLIKHQSCAASKCEIVEKLIGPYAITLVDLFFEKVNPCFPLLNETSFRRAYTDAKEKISPALLSNLYANALVYWKSRPELSNVICPDIHFVWIQANEALNSETFLSPGLSSILAMILNIGGRPSTSVLGNGGLLGAAIARANAMGLNRDPSDWSITEAEKLSRINIWWLIVVQDRWLSLAYGTPLQVNRKQFDVPVPHASHLHRIDQSSDHPVATSIFVSTITLTEVLGSILEHIYDVASPVATTAESFSDTFESVLNNWEDFQPKDIQRITLRGTNLNDPGAANLRLGYLAVKLLLRRFQVSLEARIAHRNKDRSSRYRAQAQRAAEEILHFVQELDECHFRGFWFPMHAYSLTSATLFLIRDSLSRVGTSQAVSRQNAIELIKALRHSQQKYSWDLADHCLTSYGSVVEKLGRTSGVVADRQSVLDAASGFAASELEEIFIDLDENMLIGLEDFLQDYPFADDVQYLSGSFSTGLASEESGSNLI